MLRAKHPTCRSKGLCVGLLHKTIKDRRLPILYCLVRETGLEPYACAIVKYKRFFSGTQAKQRLPCSSLRGSIIFVRYKTKNTESIDSVFFVWCEKRDLNPYSVNYTPLKRARLPVPPLSHKSFQLYAQVASQTCAVSNYVPFRHSRIKYLVKRDCFSQHWYYTTKAFICQAFFENYIIFFYRLSHFALYILKL